MSPLGCDAVARVAAADHREQRGDDLRVELVARLGLQPALGLVARQRLAVGRSDVITSQVSQANTIRDSSGIRSPARPSG